MKKIVDYTLMSLILTTVVFVTVLFAQNITRNNIWDNVPNINNKWGKIKSKAKSNGGLEALAEKEVDIDHPNEEWGWMQKDGIKYWAYARVSASWQWGTWGTYDVIAIADDDTKKLGNDWQVFLWAWERAKDASHWKEIQDNPDNFPTDDNGNAKPLDDYNADDVRSELRKCDADATIDRVVPGAVGGNANDNDNAKDAMAQPSGSCGSGGCDSGGNDDDDEYYKTTASID